MLDTSESMFSYSDAVYGFITRELLKDYIQWGDTVYLLSFADNPFFEAKVLINTRLAIEQIIQQILLLKPLGKYTDFYHALIFLNEFVSDFENRENVEIFLITDEIHDPPPDSSYPVYTKDILVRLFQPVEKVENVGWAVYLLRVASSEQGVTVDSRTSPDGSDESGAPGEPPGSQEEETDSTITNISESGDEAEILQEKDTVSTPFRTEEDLIIEKSEKEEAYEVPKEDYVQEEQKEEQRINIIEEVVIEEATVSKETVVIERQIREPEESTISTENDVFESANGESVGVLEADSVETNLEIRDTQKNLRISMNSSIRMKVKMK